MWYYRAFGLEICSEVELLQLIPIVRTETDINIKIGTIPRTLEDNYIDYHWIKIGKKEVIFVVKNVASYHIKNGNTITIQINKNIETENMALVQMYLMGTAMGALLIQRGTIPLHGSCIRREDGLTILFIGDSGAGKSTTAAFFLRNGWHIMSDDVAPVQIEDNEIVVYPSFPQQKLWDDAVKRNDLEDKKNRLLWTEDVRSKYSMNNIDEFYDKKESLDYVFQLVPKEQQDITYREIIGIEKAILLREHTYRNFLYADNVSKQVHFQQCAKVAENIKAYQICRPINVQTEKQIFEIIKQIIKKNN